MRLESFISWSIRSFFQTLQVTSWNVGKNIKFWKGKTINLKNINFIKESIYKREGYIFKKYKSKKLKNINILKAYIKIEKIIKFGDTETKKLKFYQHEEPISIKKYKY